MEKNPKKWNPYKVPVVLVDSKHYASDVYTCAPLCEDDRAHAETVKIINSITQGKNTNEQKATQKKPRG